MFLKIFRWYIAQAEDVMMSSQPNGGGCTLSQYFVSMEIYIYMNQKQILSILYVGEDKNSAGCGVQSG